MGWFAQIRKVGTIYMLHYGEEFYGNGAILPPAGGGGLLPTTPCLEGLATCKDLAII